MAKAKKAAKPAKPTPGKKAYSLLCDALSAEYDDYAAGNAEDDDFPTPAKQRKVAKQLAKLHNRMLKKIPEQNRDELDEDPE